MSGRRRYFPATTEVLGLPERTETKSVIGLSAPAFGSSKFPSLRVLNPNQIYDWGKPRLHVLNRLLNGFAQHDASALNNGDRCGCELNVDNLSQPVVIRTTGSP